MYTEKLYYLDPYLREFDAQVIARRQIGSKPAVALDRTAFYPTGGGQPNDTGVLKLENNESCQVLDVISEDDLVWHILDRDLPVHNVHDTNGVHPVHAALDWDRRFDHMQQHTGQHVLSQAFVQTCNAETVAFHLGEKASTIDLNRIDIDATGGAGGLARAEAAANAIIDQALRVTASFVTPQELAALPLRKPPKVSENIRIVQVAGFDWSACGGTHVAYTSHIQLIKIVGTERRGSELRVTFLCGRRARADYARLKALAQGLVARYTAAEDDMLDLLDRRAAEAEALRKDLAELEKQWAESTAAALWSAAPPTPTHPELSETESKDATGQLRFVLAAFDVPAERAKKVAQALRARPGAVALIAARGDRPQLFAARSDDVAAFGAQFDASALLRAAVSAGGGRGGGRPDWAQGGVSSNDAIDAAFEAARAAFAAASKTV